MEGPRRVSGRHRRAVSDKTADAADADRRPAAPHLGPDLRLPEPHQCRRRLSRQEDRRGREVRHHADDDRRSRQHPAGVLAGRGLELLGLHRRRGLSGRADQRPAVRAILAAADPRSARHEGHRLPRAAGEGAPARRLLRRRRQGRHDAAGRSDHQFVPHPALLHLRRRRAGLDRGGLSRLLPRDC